MIDRAYVPIAENHTAIIIVYFRSQSKMRFDNSIIRECEQRYRGRLSFAKYHTKENRISSARDRRYTKEGNPNEVADVPLKSHACVNSKRPHDLLFKHK